MNWVLSGQSLSAPPPGWGARGGMKAPAGLPRQGNARLFSHNMSCNFRQTFEVPDICIMCASLLATENSCLAFPRLNCNYTRPLPGNGGEKRPLLAPSKSFMFYSFPAPSNEARDSGVVPLLLLRRQIITHTYVFVAG